MRNLVYDVGMNIAEDTTYYLAKGFQVVAIEANPQMVEQARERFADEIASGQLTLLNIAVADRPGSMTFHVCETMSAWSTTDPVLVGQWSRAGAVFREIVVEGRTFADVLSEYGVPYYLKVDIEGRDMLCVEALAGFERKPDFVSVEVDLGRHRDMIATALKLGYTRFQLVPQSRVSEQKPPRPAREGADIEYSFATGCTGLFGAELPDTWDDAEAIVRKLGSIRTQHRIRNAIGKLARPVGAAKAAAEWSAKRFPATQDWYDVHMR